ncbi:MAG TPA: anthranilate phosphoribosyltransferase [Acidobacteriaceae bacterium]|jgi:anthranilate phosphoribosyltransferase
MHDLRTTLKEMVERGRTLGAEEAHAAVGAMLDGHVTDVEIAALLTVLAERGETVDEVLGVVMALRERLMPLPVTEAERAELVDTCGTGGDRCGTFNISTAAALVAAAAGAKVAKHGNRALTSRCGSADVLEALGVPVDLGPEQAVACLRAHGFVFLFAPTSHPTMRRVQPVRRALGFRNTFHLAGPLSNPAGAQAQLMGVFSREKVELVAETMARLGVRHGLVVHGADGLDELTLTGPTTVAEVRGGVTRVYEVTPEELGLERAPGEALLGADSAAGNAAILEAILRRTDTSADAGPRRNVVVLNAAACLMVAGVAADLKDGVLRSLAALQSGAAAALLERLRAFGRDNATMGTGSHPTTSF